MASYFRDGLPPKSLTKALESLAWALPSLAIIIKSLVCCLIGLLDMLLGSPGNDAECLLLRLLPRLFTWDVKFGVLGSWLLASTAIPSKTEAHCQCQGQIMRGGLDLRLRGFRRHWAGRLLLTATSGKKELAAECKKAGWLVGRCQANPT